MFESVTSAVVNLLPDPAKNLPGQQYTITVRCEEVDEPRDNATYQRREILDQVLMSYNGLTVSDVTAVSIKDDVANFSQWSDAIVSVKIVNADGDGFEWTPLAG